MAVLVKKKLGRRVEKSSPSPLRGCCLPVTALVLDYCNYHHHHNHRYHPRTMFGMLGGLALVHIHHNLLPNCHLYHLSTNTTITIFKSLYGCFEMFQLQLSKTALVDEFFKL